MFRNFSTRGSLSGLEVSSRVPSTPYRLPDMRQRESRRRPKEPPRNQPPLSAARRRSRDGITLSIVSRLIVAVICFYGMFRIFAGAGSIVVAPNSSNLQNWVFTNVSRIEQGAGHLVIECAQPCYVVSPSLSHSAVEPADHPYVKVSFDRESSIQEARILLSNRNAPEKFSPRPALLQSSYLLCDLRDRRAWNSILPYEGTIDRIGFSFSGRMLLRRIEAAGVLNFSDYVLLLYTSLTTVEPAAPSAINELHGVHLLGHSQTVVAIWIFVITSLIITGFCRSRYLKKIMFALSSVILFLYVPFFVYLVNQFKISGMHSCFRSDLFEEYASCYDADFSTLSQVLLAKVPQGSRVHFIRQSIESYRTETNFSEFVHRIRYEPRSFGDADYYVGLRWPGVYDAVTQNLKDPFTGKSLSAEPVYQLGDSFIVRARR